MADSLAENNSAATNPQQDDVLLRDARAHEKNDHLASANESEIPTKKRKTRRGKSKRKYPYIKNGRKSDKVKLVSNKPEAPHNSNQFLLEDHGIIEELDENLKCCDQVSTSTVTRTRDSSFSVDSDGEFYSSPDDEEQFLRKDFDDQYETLQAERLNSMSKNELVQEYLLLQGKLDALTRRLNNVDEEKNKEGDDHSQPSNTDEVERLKSENEMLRSEIELLRNKNITCSDSADSETDSSDSCSSSTSSSSSCTCDEDKISDIKVTYTNGNSNGHTSPPPSVEPV